MWFWSFEFVNHSRLLIVSTCRRDCCTRLLFEVDRKSLLHQNNGLLAPSSRKTVFLALELCKKQPSCISTIFTPSKKKENNFWLKRFKKVLPFYPNSAANLPSFLNFFEKKLRKNHTFSFWEMFIFQLHSTLNVLIFGGKKFRGQKMHDFFEFQVNVKKKKNTRVECKIFHPH